MDDLASIVRVTSVPDGVLAGGVMVKVAFTYCSGIKVRLSREERKKYFFNHRNLYCEQHMHLTFSELKVYSRTDGSVSSPLHS